jgi:hypothetical protein
MSSAADTSETVAGWNPRAAEELAPGQLLRQAKRLRDEAERLVEQAVVAERAKDTSWETIGEVLDGVTKSAAQKRFGSRVTSWKGTTEVTSRITSQMETGTSEAEAEFAVAYEQLTERWMAAGETVAAQDLIAHLSNATTAVSGANTEGDHHSSTRFRYNMQPLVAHLQRHQTLHMADFVCPLETPAAGQDVLEDLRAGRVDMAQPDREERLHRFFQDKLQVKDVPAPAAEPHRSLEERVRELETRMDQMIRWTSGAQQKAEQEAAVRPEANSSHTVIYEFRDDIPRRPTLRNRPRLRDSMVVEAHGDVAAVSNQAGAPHDAGPEDDQS